MSGRAQDQGAPPKHRVRRLVRRAERVVLGMAMSVIAFLAERIVLKAIREGSVKTRGEPETNAPGLAVSPDQILNE